jgi:hypothetical protein
MTCLLKRRREFRLKNALIQLGTQVEGRVGGRKCDKFLTRPKKKSTLRGGTNLLLIMQLFHLVVWGKKNT